MSATAARHEASQIGVRRILHGKLAGRATTDEVGGVEGVAQGPYLPGDQLWQNI